MNRTVRTFVALAAAAAALVLGLFLLGPDGERPLPVPPSDAPPRPGAVPGAAAPPPAPDPPADPEPEPAREDPAEEDVLLVPPYTRGAVPRDGPVAASCRGRVLDLVTGEPVTRFLLRFGTKARREGDPEDVRVFRDGRGEFRAEDLRFVPETMEVRSLGWEPQRVLFRPPEGKPWVLFLERTGFDVRGRVVDAAGAPVPGHCGSVRAELQGADALAAREKELRDAGEDGAANRVGIRRSTGTTTREDGTFRLVLHGAGTYRVTGQFPLG
ncbi:MAG: hypothetical protein MUC63_01020, partial [Planctomycetes bacterium]|nr:hypothetical protein [Planctomycetota bacterium]